MTEERYTLGQIIGDEFGELPEFNMADIHEVLNALSLFETVEKYNDLLFQRRILWSCYLLSIYMCQNTTILGVLKTKANTVENKIASTILPLLKSKRKNGLRWEREVWNNSEFQPFQEKINKAEQTLRLLENNYEVLSKFPINGDEEITNQTCKTCYSSFILTPEFFPLTRSQTQPGAYYYAHSCRNCKNELAMKRFLEEFAKDPQKIRDRNNNYLNNHREEKRAYDRNYRNNHREELNAARNARKRERRAEDSGYAIMTDMRSEISRLFREYGGSKNRRSARKELGWSKEEMIEHFAAYFKLPGNEWMNFNNRGIYNSDTWKDSDTATWTWNVDHIIPVSDFPFLSMDDDNFKKCWALSNLRPLSAKQNVLDGTSRARHTQPRKQQTSRKKRCKKK